MSSVPIAANPALAVFEPPYDTITPCSSSVISHYSGVEEWKGRALIWFLSEHGNRMSYFEALRNKPPGLPLFVLLPPPSQIRSVVDMLPLVRYLSPRMILPHGLIDTAFRLRQVLATPPRSVPAALAEYLARRGMLHRRRVAREFQRVIELSADVRAISVLCRRMYTSRRTIGRHFLSAGLPVPSHCLHFARLFHVALQLQCDDSPMFRIASRFGYSDGFTMSNQMKRMIGHRPSEVRELLGWEWIVEAWLTREGMGQ